MTYLDPFGARTPLDTADGPAVAWRLGALSDAGFDLERLPYSVLVLLESCLRNLDGVLVTEEHVRTLARYHPAEVAAREIPFMPGRVILQDFTGVPAVVDFAALRAAMARLGGDVRRVNPLVPAELVIDHSVQVDAFGTADAMRQNTELEFARNTERYALLKWGQQALDGFAVVPPETGIVHQVNLEHLAPVVSSRVRGDDRVVAFDSVVGTDSHTTMINGLGVVGWGVGGIEAEACMLGQPISMLVPAVVGFELTGRLAEGATATDLVLTVTQMLRAHGVVEKFVEFFGDGLDELTLADRATLANMAPEYGATIGFFPIDDKTLAYLRLTGRSEDHIALVEAYARLNGLWRRPRAGVAYESTLTLDLARVVPSLAGPSRPQDRVALPDMRRAWDAAAASTFRRAEPHPGVPVTHDGHDFVLRDGAVVIAAITSCTNTSNPSVMIAAGLVAQKAAARGLRAQPWVKTSLAPGSRVVTDYLDRAGLSASLEALGFYTVGYGCTTCIGNTGPLPEPIAAAIDAGKLVVASVLSGNRNFEGRISPHVRANYLASPPLVVAFAIAGRVDVDLTTEPLGVGSDRQPVFLRDVWPSLAEVGAVMDAAVTREAFVARYAHVFDGPPRWRALEAPTGSTYPFDPASTYVQEPPFFRDMGPPQPIRPVRGARCLLLLGHSITTDHISPAGSIPKGSPAGRYLEAHGVARAEWNSFGSRRGNDQVMTRGTFGNIRIRNLLAAGTEGGVTPYLGPDGDPTDPVALPYAAHVVPRHGEVVSVYDASVRYQQHGVPLVVIAGKDYGMGSSRDWAAKGTFLLGVKVVIAESYERIHRSNLVGMGVVPLQFLPGDSASSLGLTGHETFDVALHDALEPLQTVTVTATRPDGSSHAFEVQCRIDTPIELVYARNGGVLHTVLRRLAQPG
jgi:aconitate hydratase